MPLEFKTNPEISVNDFIDILHRSGLAARRPVEDHECMQGMLKHANLIVAAYNSEKLVGIARSITDFYYACYLSDLAVDKAWQGSGVGKSLQRKTQDALGSKCKLILLAAPAAESYYGHVGYNQHPSCFVLERNAQIK